MLHLSPAAGRMKPDIQQFRANRFDSSRQRALANWVKLLVASGTFQSQRFLQQRIATSRTVEANFSMKTSSRYGLLLSSSPIPPPSSSSLINSMRLHFSIQSGQFPEKGLPGKSSLGGKKNNLQTSFWTIKNTSVLGKDYSLWIIPSLLQLL